MYTTDLLLAGIIICQILSLLFVLLLVKQRISSLTNVVRLFFEITGDQKQSHFADIVDLIASRLASAIVASAKGFLMAENSAAVRQDKAAARRELLASNPLMGIAAKYAPGLIRKNPELAQMAINYFTQKRGENDNNNGQHESGPRPGDPFKI